MLQSIINRTKFPQVYSIKNELKKAAILRILLGLVVFVRYYEIVYSMSIFSPGMLLVESIGFLTLIIFFIFGFITPLTTVALIFSVSWFDSITGTGTLGTYILIQVLIVLLLMNHGLYGSLDSWLMQSEGYIAKIIKKVYNILGKPSSRSIRSAYFIGFLFYAFTSLGAIILHIQDSYWIQGLTTQSLLGNSYLFKFYDTMRYFEEYFPNTLYIISASSGLIQSVFQFLMIPLIFFNWGRKFIVAWGLLFFIISLIGINLSYLPHIEIIFWLLIFFVINPKEKKVTIIYDDYCSLCTRGMQCCKAINFNGKYNFVALSTNKELYENKGISENEVRMYMVGLVNNKKYVGYELYIEMFKVNSLLWVFLPFLYLGKIMSIGSRIYNYIAERRYKVFGVCSISSENLIQKEFSLDFLTEKRLIVSIFQSFLILVLIAFIVLKFPLGIRDKVTQNIATITIPIVNKCGLVIANVFNRTDLSMGDNWLVIYRKDNSMFNTIPITDIDGARLTYEGLDILNFSNHNSDFFYFGNTLNYRRKMIHITDENILDFHTKGYGYKSIKKRIQYDYNKMKLTQVQEYKIEVYRSTSSVVKKWNSNKDRHKANKIYSSNYLYDGNVLTQKSY